MKVDSEKIYSGYAAKHFGYFTDFPEITGVWAVGHTGKGKGCLAGYKLFASNGDKVVAKYHSVDGESIDIAISKLKEIIIKTKI